MYHTPNCDHTHFQGPFELSHFRKMNLMIVLDVEEMIESRRLLLEFLLNRRSKCQFKNIARKIKQKLFLYISIQKLVFVIGLYLNLYLNYQLNLII